MDVFINQLRIPEQVHVLCVVGAGGKTSLLYQLAKEYHKRGKSVLLTTTTKMFLPQQHGVWNGSVSVIAEKLAKDGFVVAGIPVSNNKMGPLPWKQYEIAAAKADIVLLECDGAKRLPLKMPQTGEPVFPPQYDFLITVTGLSCLDRPLKEVCHRFLLAQQVLHCKEDHIVREFDVVQLLQAGYGSFWEDSAGCVYLNQADCISEHRVQHMAKLFPIPCVWGSLYAKSREEKT